MKMLWTSISIVAQLQCSDVRQLYRRGECCKHPDGSIPSSCVTTVPTFNFGFPACYPTIPSAKETYLLQANTNEFGARYMMPVLGKSALQPYNTFSIVDCKGAETHYAVTLPPHYSPIQPIIYHETTRLGHLSSKFNRNVMVSGVGSWHTFLGAQHQRNGQTVMSFKMGLTHKVEALEQEMLVPNTNQNSFVFLPDFGFSPTGLHQSASGALLFTSKRGTMGLFAITSSQIPSNMNVTWNGMSIHRLEGATSELRRIKSKIVDGSEWILTSDRSANEIKARILREDYSVSDEFVLANSENAMDGLEVVGDTLYFATSSNSVKNSGVYKIDNLSEHLTKKTRATGVLFERDHLYLRSRHDLNDIAATPDGKYMIIMNGNAANWAPHSTGTILAKDMVTGVVYNLATGVRNPTGIAFDWPMAYITQMGSDRGRHTWSNANDDLGSFAPGDSIVSIDMRQWSPEELAPKNTDIDDRERLLEWTGSSCAELLAKGSCADSFTVPFSDGPSESFVHILCPKSCKEYIESL